MSEERPAIPGYWKFLWLFFMQPVSLHGLLKSAGIENPDARPWVLWRAGGASRMYLLRSTLLLVTSPFGATAIFLLFREKIDIAQALFGVTMAITAGVVVSLNGVAWGVAFGVALGATFGVVGDIIYSLAGMQPLTLLWALSWALPQVLALAWALALLWALPRALPRAFPGVLASAFSWALSLPLLWVFSGRPWP